MKHLKLFERFEDIDSICKKYGITNYTINSDDTVDVDGDVDLPSIRLSKLPIKFGKVSGAFYCHDNKLTTLEGSPSHVGGFYCSNNYLTTLEGCPSEVSANFSCRQNQLTTLKGCPSHVGGDFDCRYNRLITLEGGPNHVNGNFNCNDNQLSSLEGSPSEVGGYFNCSSNQLTTLEGGPSNVNGNFNCSGNNLITLEGGPNHVGGYFNCYGNPVCNIYNLFNDYKSFKDSLDYNYLRGTDIVKSRFKEALEETGIKIPKEIKGYNWI
jgi:hypothetical protein